MRRRSGALAAAMLAVPLVACAGGTATSACDELAAWAEAGFRGAVAITAADDTCDTGVGTDPDAVFGIGSVSKAVAAAAVLQLVDAGRLSLDDRAGDLLPGLGGPAADALVRDLLLHTSGLHGEHGVDHQPLSRTDAIAALGRLEQAAPPGSTFLYSNAGYSLLALIVEEVAGVDYREHLTSEVLRAADGSPLGGFWDGEPAAPGPRADSNPGARGDFAGPHWALAGNGDVAMSMPELAAWVRSLFTGTLLSPESIRTIIELRFEREDGSEITPGWAALDRSRFGEPVLATAGGGGELGHNVVVAWLPESERVVAMASSGDGVLAEDLLQAVGPALVAGDPLPEPRRPGGRVDRRVAGRYVLGTGGHFEVRVDDDALAVVAVGADAFAALFPLPAAVHPREASGHEARVRALLAGETTAGRQELTGIREELGAVEQVEVIGTEVAEGDLRTHVELVIDGELVRAWYSVDGAGGIQAAEIGTDPPTVRLVPDGDRFRPDDPTGLGPDVVVAFEDDTMSVDDVEATRS